MQKLIKVKPAIIETPYGWYAGTSEEYMNIGGPFDTREEAIEVGRHNQGGDAFFRNADPRRPGWVWLPFHSRSNPASMIKSCALSDGGRDIIRTAIKPSCPMAASIRGGNGPSSLAAWAARSSRAMPVATLSIPVRVYG
jgi:hypothetical protein